MYFVSGRVFRQNREEKFDGEIAGAGNTIEKVPSIDVTDLC